MVDKARQWTDKRLAKMEREIAGIYRTASKGIYKSWNEYMQKADKKTAKLQKQYDDAKQSGDKELIRKTGMKLSQQKKEVTLQNQQYKAMLDETTTKLAHTNEIALAYVNGELPAVYTFNYNHIGVDVERFGINFGLVNEETVKRLIMNGDIDISYKKLNVLKDKRWNTKQINSAVLQGILQGESMDKIAKRLYHVMDNNKQAAVRNARTLVTGAENVGKYDRYVEMDQQGIVQKKVWLATGDGRTRDWHLDMDGEEVEIDEEFSNGLMYPGDPKGDAAEVYNCRCAMVTHVIGFRNSDGSVRKIKYEDRGEDLHDREIEAEKRKRKDKA